MFKLLLGFLVVFLTIFAEGINMDASQFAPAWPHGEIQEILPDIFFVTGTNKVQHEGINIQTSRNMVIMRHGSELTLINTVRLGEEGLKRLNKLGKVAYIVRIGAFHGRDDAFYKKQYPSAHLCVLKGMVYESGLKPDKELIAGEKMSFPHCSLFVFETSNTPEGILYIDREGGILITCDSIQNITATDQFYSLETAKSFYDQGLVKPANISSIWLGATHTERSDFERLLTIKFRHLITAHGEPLLNGAYEQVHETFNRVFSEY
jgi:hypothetical protein